MDTRALTNGRDRAKGWTEDEAGNWTPSLHDRRRVVSSHVIAVLEAQGQASGEEILAITARHSTDKADFEALAEKLGAWVERNLRQQG